MIRSRVVLGCLACLLVAAGLATRSSFAGGLVASFGGDTLWATLMVVLVLIVRPALSARNTGLVALALAVAVELSQLLDWPVLMALRSTWLGGLALGHGFLWSDLACYVLGVGLGLLLDFGMFRAGRRRAAAVQPTLLPPRRQRRLQP